ncbi:MAG TPA: HAMP domain-containing sensor histidine kinase [bacterium]|jgi:signal transduction histidine kinase
MKLNLLSVMKSRRRFGIALAAVMLLIVAGIGLFQWTAVKRLKASFESGREYDRWKSCFDVAVAARDYTYDVFAPHVNALNETRLGEQVASDSMLALLRRFEMLPGVRHAYCLANRATVLWGNEPAPAGLADGLTDCRKIFEKYPVGATHYVPKIANRMENRARFVDMPVQGDTIRMILAGFDSSGCVVPFLRVAATDPSLIAYVIALDVDPQWIRQAVAQRMQDVFYSRMSFVLWSPSPIDTTQTWLDGLGVIFLGDTVWWQGLKSADVGYVFPALTGPAMPWLSFSAVYREDPAEWKRWAAYQRQPYIMLVIVDVIAGGLALLLVWMLVLVRRQWLARQTALTHLAHSIRTPVARLRLEVDTLQEKRAVSPEEEREVVQAIGNECGRIERAVQNAAISLNGNGQTLERRPDDLSQIIGDALNPWKSTFHSTGVALQVPSTLRAMPGQFDGEMIVTMLDNLLDNALRYTRIQLQKSTGKPQTVAVALRTTDGTAVLTVDDSDGGVPPQDRPRIFLRFERGSDPALTGASGLGLGLALVKDIAEAHGGSVSVGDSELGGARFTVILPLEGTAIHIRSTSGAHSDRRG